MESLNPVEWEVLNATADDIENLEQLYSKLRGQTSTTLSEVADAVHSLVEKGLLTIRIDENGRP